MLVAQRRALMLFASSIALLFTLLAGTAAAHIASNYGGVHTFTNTGNGVTATADDTVGDGHCTYAGVWDGSKWYEGPKSCGSKQTKWHDTANNPSHGFGYGCITGHWACKFKVQWSG